MTMVIDGSVAVVTLDRPAMNLALTEALLDAAITCEKDRGIRAVLINASGKMFCAGGDVKAFEAAGPVCCDLIAQTAANLHAAVSRLARMDKPLVVAVQGVAAGAGLSLAMLGDFVLAGRSARFSLNYSAIGLTPDGGASWLLPRLVGLRKAQELLLTNAQLSADEALDAGLLTQVVADEDLAAEAMRRAQALANGPTMAFARARRLLLGSYGNSLEDHLEHEANEIVKSARGADGQEGIAAFVAKRQPKFTGA